MLDTLIREFRIGTHTICAELAEYASDEWGFNCGPASLCAVTGLEPEELRPALGDFEDKRYTNPTLMRAILDRLGMRYRWRVVANQDVTQDREAALPSFGLARIQWGGPWCQPEVNPRARYRYTHWIATSEGSGDDKSRGVFDVNNNTGCDRIGWTHFSSWSKVVVPSLVASYKRADGSWWVTHSVEVLR